MGFTNDVDLGCETKRGIEGRDNFLFLKNWKNLLQKGMIKINKQVGGIMNFI